MKLERMPTNRRSKSSSKFTEKHVNYCYISSPRAINKNAKNKHYIPSYREKIYVSNDVIYRRGKNTEKNNIEK